MIILHKNEKVLLILRRHWIIVLLPTIATILLFFAPFILHLFVNKLVYVFIAEGFQMDIPPLSLKMFLFLNIYWLIVIGVYLHTIVSYWLDAWIITNERIIDIEQVRLFHRIISEFPLAHIQDVTVSIPGILATFLDFGNITIHTAGEEEFMIRDVPHSEHVRRIIREHQMETVNHGRTLKMGTNKT